MKVSGIPLPGLSYNYLSILLLLLGSVHSSPILLVFQAELRHNLSGYSKKKFYFIGMLFVFKNIFTSYKHLQLSAQEVFEKSFRIHNWQGILLCFVFYLLLSISTHISGHVCCFLERRNNVDRNKGKTSTQNGLKT